MAERRDIAVGWTVPRAYTNSASQVLLYRWAAPKTTKPNVRYPLVIHFHGAGERGDNNTSQLSWGAYEFLSFMQKPGHEGYYIAGQVPKNEQWVNTPWGNAAHRMPKSPSRPMALALELIEKTMREFPVDPARVYVTGLSMGGYGTWDALQRRPDLFAAALPFCGGGDAHLAWKIRDVPIWAWHGDADGAVPVVRSREMVSALWSVDGRIRYTEVPGCGHGVWNVGYADAETFEWLFAQRRTGGDSSRP